MSDFDFLPQKKVLYRLVTLPSVDTIKRLLDILSHAPTKFDPFQTHHVTIARAHTEQSVQVLRGMYEDLHSSWNSVEFNFETFDYRFDEHILHSKIEANVACNAIELIRQNLFMSGYPPVYQFLHQAPPLSKALKSFVISVADTLVMKEHSFTFNNLYLLSEADYTENFKSQFLTSTWDAPWGQVM
jgi:hypothetical protein